MPTEDQASKLRKLMRQARETRTIAVISGKGGVGKSNVAVNLAILLSAGGSRVCIVDGDFALANLDVLLDVSASFNLSHVISGKKRVQDIVVDLACGVQLVPGASGLAQMADLSDFERVRLVEELTSVEADNDVIVVDCGAGIGPDTMHFAMAADNTIVVTTPEPTAVTDAYAAIKVLHQRGYSGGISLLVNFATDRHEARAMYTRIAHVARQFLGARVFDGGYVINDPKVAEAVRRREPFVLAYPRCTASRCVAALANKLGPGGALARKEGGGFFKRLANWFA